MLGCAAGTKLTGWFLPLPFLAWVVLERDRRGVGTLVVGGLVAALTLYALTPPWWGEPLAGLSRFFRSNLTRGETIPIRVQFLGDVYETPNDSLPWYNTLVWTLMVTPAGFLLLGVLGAWRAVSRRAFGDRSGGPLALLAAGHWAFFLILRALPHTPGHDGVRLFLPAFGCLALAAGQGGAWVVERLGRWGKGAIVAALAEAAVGLAVMMPVPLSYYSPLVGGLPGATRLGMEPTYYWDALTPSALAWLNRHTPADQTVFFASNPVSWFYLRETGQLRPGIFPFEGGPFAWYVVQNRPAR